MQIIYFVQRPSNSEQYVTGHGAYIKEFRRQIGHRLSERFIKAQ